MLWAGGMKGETSAANPPVSLATAVAVVVASMVGTGVFTSLGFQVRDVSAGFPILVLWVLGGLVSLCGAFCYAELVAMMPRSGGEYHLLSSALHPMAGFLAGWVSITAGFAAPMAAAGVVFGTYMADLFPELGIGVRWYGLALLLLVAGVQLLSLQFVERFQVGFTVMKLGLIGIFVLGALWMGANRWELLLPKSGEGGYYVSQPYAIALVYVMYAYTGWNGAVYVAGEMADVKRQLPRALMMGTLGVMVLYVGLNAVFLMSAPWSVLEGKPEVALVAARSIFGAWGGNGMGGIIAFGLVAHMSAMLFAGTRVLRVIGEDVWFMRWMNRRNPAGAPWLAVVVLAGTVLVLMMSGTFEQLLLYIQGLLLMSSMLCVVAVPWLRWRSPGMERPFKVPLYPLPPLVFVGVTGWMLWALVGERPVESAWGLLTLVVGAGLYALKKMKG